MCVCYDDKIYICKIWKKKSINNSLVNATEVQLWLDSDFDVCLYSTEPNDDDINPSANKILYMTRSYGAYMLCSTEEEHKVAEIK